MQQFYRDDRVSSYDLSAGPTSTRERKREREREKEREEEDPGQRIISAYSSRPRKTSTRLGRRLTVVPTLTFSPPPTSSMASSSTKLRNMSNPLNVPLMYLLAFRWRWTGLSMYYSVREGGGGGRRVTLGGSTGGDGRGEDGPF